MPGRHAQPQYSMPMNDNFETLAGSFCSQAGTVDEPLRKDAFCWDNGHSFKQDFGCDLRAHVALCEEAMTLTAGENQALSSRSGYQPAQFYKQRKGLLPRLEKSLMALRKWRQRWQSLGQAERQSCSEVTSLFRAAQSLLMRLLLLDGENQQALLRRGLLPAGNIPARAVQQPHCVADLYRRHARG
jgi:hypothetical protein